MIETSISSRLKELIRFLGLSDSQFADKCEISRATLSLLLSGKNKKISDVFLSQIHRSFPEVSILWILFGEGQISNPLPQSEENENQKNYRDVSIFPEDDTEEETKLNLLALKRLEPVIQNIVTEAIDHYFDEKSIGLQSKTEKSKPRKVKQITVYYDDSTFETFREE